MFEKTVELLLTAMRNYNSNIHLHQTGNSYECLAQYMILKDLLENCGHIFHVTTKPVYQPNSPTGVSFVFTELKFREIYFESHPFMARLGFACKDGFTKYEFPFIPDHQ